MLFVLLAMISGIGRGWSVIPWGKVMSLATKGKPDALPALENPPNLSLTLKGRVEDFNYQLECDMGSLTIGSQDYSGFSLEKTISHGAAKEMDLACAMGNIEVLFQN